MPLFVNGPLLATFSKLPLFRCDALGGGEKSVVMVYNILQRPILLQGLLCINVRIPQIFEYVRPVHITTDLQTALLLCGSNRQQTIAQFT